MPSPSRRHATRARVREPGRTFKTFQPPFKSASALTGSLIPAPLAKTRKPRLDKVRIDGSGGAKSR
jgi:hypothetical protein